MTDFVPTVPAPDIVRCAYMEIVVTDLPNTGDPDNPANGVHWLANKIAAHGDSMKARDIILAGSFTRPLWVYQGDTVHADYGPLGSLTCRLE